MDAYYTLNISANWIKGWEQESFFSMCFFFIWTWLNYHYDMVELKGELPSCGKLNPLK